MPTRIYEFPGDKSRASDAEDLAAAIREVTPAVKTIAEELRRRQTVRTLRAMARGERQERPTRVADTARGAPGGANPGKIQDGA